MSTQAQEQWQLEAPSAEAYERYAVPSWSRPLASSSSRWRRRAMASASSTWPAARASSPGSRRGRLGERGTVAGVDLNDGMLDVARAHSAAIDWLPGDAAALPLADEACDLVLCQQGLQFFPRRDAALADMYRARAPRRAPGAQRHAPDHPTTRAGARWRTPSRVTRGPRPGR